MADDAWDSNDERSRDNSDFEPPEWEMPVDLSAALAWFEGVDIDRDDLLASLVQNLGRPEAADLLLWLGDFERGDPESAILMQKLRDLRVSGTLSHDAHFFIVTEIMEDQEFRSADGDAETMALLERVRELSRQYNATCTPDEDQDWELERAPQELRETNAEWSMRCRSAWLEWLRELGEEEVAHLAERDPQAYQRRRIAGESAVTGTSRIALAYRTSALASDGFFEPSG